MLGSKIDDLWSSVKPVNHRILQFGRHKFLAASFIVQDNPEGSISYSVLALTIHAGHFLKIRYTLPLPGGLGEETDIAHVELKMNDFLKEVALVLP